MKIVTIPVSEMQKVRRQRPGRARSEESQRLIDAITSLAVGQARAVELDEDEDPKKVRAKVAYASRAAGRKVRIVVDDHRVLFARETGRSRSSRS